MNLNIDQGGKLKSDVNKLPGFCINRVQYGHRGSNKEIHMEV